MSTKAQVPQALQRIVDDAAVLPPGDVPLPEAVAAHRRHRAAAYASVVGSLAVTDRSLPELEALAAEGAEPLAVAVVVTGGAGSVEPAVRRATATPHLAVEGVEVALRDLDDLAGNARRVVAALDTCDGVPEDGAYVELPMPQGTPGHGWLTALDEVAGADLRLTLRVGAPTPEAFPGGTTVAACVDAALDREVPFRCRPGRRAVRHRDPRTGFEHHGFLNVLLATRAAWDGAGVDDVAGLLEDTDAERVGAACRESLDDLARARRWFTSCGCCEVDDAVADLRALGLLAGLPGAG